MRALTVLQKGESLPFEFDRGDNSIDGWTCTISVKTKPSAAVEFTRVIPPLNGKWPGFITQSESSALAIGLFYLIALLEDTSTDEQEIITVRFRISTEWA